MAKPLGLPNKLSPVTNISSRSDNEHANSSFSSSGANTNFGVSSVHTPPLGNTKSIVGSPFTVSFRSWSPDLLSLRSLAMDGARGGHDTRPRTAGETASVKNSKEWLEQRMAMGTPIELATEKDIFRFPTPVRRPATTNNSPYFTPGKMSPDSGIGIAIGSPTQQPAPFFPIPSGSRLVGGQDIDDTFKPPVRAQTTQEFKSEDINGAKPRLNRWRSLGGLFGRKRAATYSNYSSNSQSRSLSRETLKSSERSLTPARSVELGVSTVVSVGSPMPQLQGQPPQAPSSVFRRVTRKGTRVRSPSTKSRDSPSPPLKDEMPSTPRLEIEIPDVKLERYSVMFKELEVLPTRSSSLLARRQALGAGSRPLPGQSIRQLEIQPGRLTRRATEPSPRESPSYRLFPGELKPQTKLPHISTLSTLHRPRPIKRNKSAPGALPSPLPHEQKLSPAFEADELEYDDKDHNTPTPSSPASPSTPKSFPSEPLPDGSIKALGGPLRQNSWDRGTPDSQLLQDSSWEMITVAKRLSPGDLLNRTESQTSVATEQDDWVEETPQVAVARSLSVTKAGNRQKLHVRPTRVSSRRSATGSVKIIDTSKDRLPIVQNVAARPAIGPRSHTQPMPHTSSRRQELRRDLTREIWGERDFAVVQHHVRENKVLLPNVCVVEEIENRKSVWGVIESA